MKWIAWKLSGKDRLHFGLLYEWYLLVYPSKWKAAWYALKEKEKLICVWKKHLEHEMWDTECGNSFILVEGVPIQDEMNFCPYCGKVLKEEINEDI